VSLTDVRCKAGVSTCAGTALSDYTGQLEMTGSIRLTDKFNDVSSGGGTDSATVTDLEFPVTVPCTPTAGSEGGACSISTTANTLMPGAIKDTKRTVAALDQVEMMDGGADGLVSTADNDVFAVQGIFIP
jgi:hypothetical protein